MSKSLSELKDCTQRVNEKSSSEINPEVLEYVDDMVRKEYSEKDIRKGLKKKFHLSQDEIELIIQLNK